jgi:hypothetical protein
MNMSDGESGRVLWYSSNWGEDMFEREYQGKMKEYK